MAMVFMTCRAMYLSGYEIGIQMFFPNQCLITGLEHKQEKQKFGVEELGATIMAMHQELSVMEVPL